MRHAGVKELKRKTMALLKEAENPVAGHIPGALNRPCAQNLGADQRFKSAAQLRAEFTALLGERAPASVVHQCGSGVTACHNLLAMNSRAWRARRYTRARGASG